VTCHYCQASAKKFGKFGPKKIQRYRCLQCGKTFSAEQEKPLDDMRVDLDKAVQVINLLVEGVGINAAARIAGVNKRTVLSLLELAGERCSKLMDTRMRNLHIEEIQADEIWGFVQKKAKALRPTDDKALVGDQYTYVALDPNTKLVVTFLVGRRDAPNTVDFMRDLSERVVSDVQISTDSFGAYRAAIRRAFGPQVDYGQQVKVYDRKSDGRNSPPEVVAVLRTPISGTPIESKISTCLVERGNLNMRTFMRRLTRLCLGFSKKLENLKHAVALYFAWSNFCRIHSTIKTSPAVAAGLTDHVWTLEELLRGAA
jgi:transposase-like protein/IS1 family transposase